jgi:hypothetical protein
MEVNIKKQEGSLKFIICLGDTQHSLVEYLTDPMAETEGDAAVPRWSYPMFGDMTLPATVLAINDQETTEAEISKEPKRDFLNITTSMPIIPLSLAHKIRLEASTAGVWRDTGKVAVQQVNLMELVYLAMDEEKIGDWLKNRESLNLSNLRHLAQYFLFKINNSVVFYQ